MKMRKGFTLIELLIVLAIVGILVSMVAGAIQNKKTTYRANHVERVDAPKTQRDDVPGK